MSKDLYSEVTHFVLELVQNADDNTYPHGTLPKLVFELIGPVLSIRCNEAGFNEDDVRAICAIRRSTKKDPSRYIGEYRLCYAYITSLIDMFLGAKGIGMCPSSIPLVVP